MGVIRPYITRHGNGILPTEDKMLEKAIPDIHNTYNEWQGKFRIGWQDLILMKYAVNLAKPDYIAMTNIDKIAGMNKIKIGISYEYYGNANVDRYFECKRNGHTCILQTLKKESVSGQCQELNSIFNESTPVYKTFDNYKDYFTFLESDEGINTPINILSFGIEAADKYLIN